MLKDAGGGRSEAELLAAFGCGVELFFFFFFSGSLFSIDSLFLSLLKLERASLASSSLSLYNHAEPRSPEATAAAADGRLASQRYGISIADEAFFGGSLSLSRDSLSTLSRLTPFPPPFYHSNKQPLAWPTSWTPREPWCLPTSCTVRAMREVHEEDGDFEFPNAFFRR